MSRSLSIECEWLDQPVADDLLERKTWAAVRISVAGRTVTRLWDRYAQGERTTLHIPAFPLAQWIVTHWWSLLYEPSRSEEALPNRWYLSPTHRAWMERHCLRAAESGLLLPRVCLFSDGRHACAGWWADDQDAYPHMPGYFVESGLVYVEREGVEDGLREFVSKVLARAKTTNDVRATRLQENWKAVTESDAGESAFCRAAGRMGLDPYDADKWAPEMVALLETEIGDDPEKPLVEDFLEAADVSTAVCGWNWIKHAEQSLALQQAPRLPALSIPAPWNPAEKGYYAAAAARNAAGLDSAAAVVDLDAVAKPLGIGALQFQDYDRLSVDWVRAAVGWRAGGRAVVAGPRPTRQDSFRFLEARGLYHAVFACQRGARLVTDAHTWDQKVSRAFAAELLAPREALIARTGPRMCADDALIGSLAAEYSVSRKVIEHQLENAGVRMTE